MSSGIIPTRSPTTEKTYVGMIEPSGGVFLGWKDSNIRHRRNKQSTIHAPLKNHFTTEFMSLQGSMRGSSGINPEQFLFPYNP